jgi:CDP-diacylglycerol---glycerol-3-phosphate 3-phosphatidyltransferase
MTWNELIAGWARADRGYDLRYAAAPRRKLLVAAYRISGLLARFGVRTASMMVLSVLFAVAVPLIALRGGGWPLAAAVLVVAGLAADTIGFGLTVVTGGITRLSGFYQSLAERFSEVCWLMALALLGTKDWLIFSIAAAVWAHEYIKARVGAPALRPTATTTVGDRPTRVWSVLAALVLAAASAQLGQDIAAGAVTLVVLSWLALALVGLGQLLTVVRKVLA